MSKRVAIIGAGPGGLAAGMILAHRGFDVNIFEKSYQVGGRNGGLELGDFKFDIGPTFLMMKFFLDETFAQTGRSTEDYLDIVRLNPMYRVKFDERELLMYTEPEKVKQQIAQLYPGQEAGLDKFLRYEEKRFNKFFGSLRQTYSTPLSFLTLNSIKALPLLLRGRQSLFDYLGRYFSNEELRLAFTFHAKYLGMSPWTCPSFFSTLAYLEHKFGIYHVTGGLYQITRAMAKVIQEEGGTIHLNTPVAQINVVNKKVTGVKLESGEDILADAVITNADFSYSMQKLLAPETTHKYTPAKLAAKKYSCSTFMMYLGLNKQYDIPHHNLISASNYYQHVQDIFRQRELSMQDTSFYVCNTAATDATMAPAGKTALYILVPVPNNRSNINWAEAKSSFRKVVLDHIKTKTELADIEQFIEQEHIITPQDWEQDYNVHLGAVFNLAHTPMQMAYFRPHNRFEELDNMYLVGGGTNPGSALPTIYESARLVANMLSKKHRVKYQEPVFSVFE